MKWKSENCSLGLIRTTILEYTALTLEDPERSESIKRTKYGATLYDRHTTT